jgi:hypothetical protein
MVPTHSTNYLKSPPDCETTFRGVLIPYWPNWNSEFAGVSIVRRPTAWYPAAAPKTVKLPCPARLVTTVES